MKTLRFRFRFAWLAFSLLSGLAQAAERGTTIPLPDEDRLAVEKYLGSGVVRSAIPAPEIADTNRYLAANPSTREFRLVSGRDAGQTERHQPTLLKREAGGITWRYDSGGKFVYFLTAKANGDYVVTGVEDTQGGAITRYSPSEPFMLQGFAPGEERNVKLGVNVFDLSNPDEQTHEGTLDVNYRYVGAYKVRVPAGSFDAVLMKWIFKGKIGPASVDDTQYRFFAPDVGMVAGVEQLDVSALLNLQPPR
jgi:hypothetical protein